MKNRYLRVKDILKGTLDLSGITWKRTVSVLLSVATFCTAVVVAPPMQAQAAALPEYYSRFRDDITGDLRTSITLLEGESVKTVIKVPPEFNMNPTLPFRIVDNLQPGQTPISVDASGNITANKVTAPSGSETYTVRANFYAFVKESKAGIAKGTSPDPAEPADPTKDKAFEYAFTTEVLSKELSITETNTFTLTVKDDQADADAPILFKPAVVSGSLAGDYDGREVSFVEKKAGALILHIQTKNGDPLELKISCPSLPSIIKANSTFVITFPIKGINDLQLTVMSGETAVNELANHVGTFSSFSDYVTLGKGEDRTAIKTQMSLVHKLQRYNNTEGFSIDWKWRPDPVTPENQSVLSFIGEDGATSWYARPNPKREDVSGHLVATVSVKLKKGLQSPTAVVAELPITILGTGIMPSFTPLEAYTGGFTNGAYGETVEQLNGKLPDDFELDVNNGRAENFQTTVPYYFKAKLKYGTGLGRAAYIKIKTTPSNLGQVEIYIDGSQEKYAFNSEIKNPVESNLESELNIEVRAASAGKADLEITYYTATGIPMKDAPTERYYIPIKDSSPSKDASFKSIELNGKLVSADQVKDENGFQDADLYADYSAKFEKYFGRDGAIKEPFYTFNTVTLTYDVILPWAVGSIFVSPKYNAKERSDGSIVYGGNSDKIDKGLDNNKSREIFLTEGESKTITINGMAQDQKTPSEYIINVRRQPRSSIASLTALSITTKLDNKTQAITPVFNPDTSMYRLELPYAYRSKDGVANATISATSFGDWGFKPEITGTVSPSFMQRVAGVFGGNTHSKDVVLTYEILADGTINNNNRFTITAMSEDRTKPATYLLDVVILDPSRNTKLISMRVLGKDNETVIPFAGGTVFNQKLKEYTIEVPFKADTVWFELLPEDEKAQKIRVAHPAAYPSSQTEYNYKNKGKPISFKANIPYKAGNHNETMKFVYKFDVQAESDQWTNDDGEESYTVIVERLPANTDSRLKSLAVVNITDSKPLDSFQFIQSKTEYSFTVPYTTEEVLVTPVAVQQILSEVVVNGTKITGSRLNKNVPLVAGKSNKIEVTVTPESGAADKTVYTLNITREAPSTEARLKSLSVGGGEKMLPDPFVPATLNYTVQIPEGTKEYTVSALPVDSNATVTVNGKAVANGQASAPLSSVEARSTITVVVTAQDGRSKKTYTIKVTDYNLVKKSNNADLSDVKLYYADISPAFKSGTDAYEVYLKAGTTAFEITPVKANANSTMKVLVGSKELKGYGGKYNTSLFGNKTTVTVNLTSEDGKVERNYTFDVFKNTKNKEGAFKPITAEMVDYTAADPIVIDISNYAVVDATVFNTLKTEYPDKTIIFAGNDYMLRIKGSDIKELVPHATQYDLFFSFTTPDQDEIDSMLWSSGVSDDWNAKPVYIHFNDHGSLPGQMLLTVSLGGKYKNSTLFWNYYNPERDRIDYYGYVQSNAKGTITVPLAHMSTYLVTTKKLTVSEDKTSTGFGSFENGTHTGGSSGNISGGITSDKKVPQTGVGNSGEDTP